MTMPMSRRTVLTAATLSAGAGLIKVSGPGLLLTPVAGRPLPVRSPDAAPPSTCPRQLAVQVVNPGSAVAAGAEVTFTYDPRLYAPASPVIVTAGSRRVEATSAVGTDPATGLTTSRISVRERIPAGATLLVVAATAHPWRYPYDLVRRPAGTSAAVVPRSGAAGTRRDLGQPRAAGRPAPTPWGIELTGGWARQTWGGQDRFAYYRPVSVRLRGTGPGPAPRPASFSIAVDPRLVATVATGAARLNGRPVRSPRRAGLTSDGVVHETRWTSDVRLGPGDVLDIEVLTGTRTPPGPLETIKHPAVTLTVPGDDAQRLTGFETLTRSDAVWR
ncbi:hypothetical protein [Actinoplanes subtropicus]|uniref:hypothetical protein n=1 Tax=Actinoplanes subtropicus TaxID=543632 RepID=UPI0004C3A430|nr:hypothetical protein [Actinoplanes subtropicus]